MAYVEIDLNEFDDDELIKELELRGYVVTTEAEKTNIETLYYDWTSLNGGDFEKKLVKFFSDALGKTIVI